MQISGSDSIAGLALLVSLGSLYYAKKTAEATRMANRVNLHQPRAAIFRALFDFRSLFVDMDLHPTDEEIQRFYVQAVLPSTLYLPAPMTERMYAIYKRSLELYREIERAETHGPTGSKWNHINALQDLGKRDLDDLVREVAKEFDLGTT